MRCNDDYERLKSGMYGRIIRKRWLGVPGAVVGDPGGYGGYP